MYLWTSEFVSEGHPDKVADQIADAILDVYLAGDPYSRVACEVTITRDFVLLSGEIKSEASPDVPNVVRSTLAGIGYGEATGFNPAKCRIENLLHRQSPEIGKAVGDKEALGAGDQGMMFGYASNESHCFMPLAIYLAREIIRELQEDRRQNPDSPLCPDAKSQVTLACREDRTLDHLPTVVVSTCHRSGITLPQIRDYIQALIERSLLPRLPEQNVADAFSRAKYVLNPAGTWTLGGPAADTGLSGRKIVVDNYGSDCPIGGGSFSGKDASKVDRSGAYAARHVAKNLVAAGLGDRAQVQVAYAIGVAEPVSLRIRAYEGSAVREIEPAILGALSLTPSAIIERFGLQKAIFRETAAGGHFGREPVGDTFAWERLDLADSVESFQLFTGDSPLTR